MLKTSFIKSNINFLVSLFILTVSITACTEEDNMDPLTPLFVPIIVKDYAYFQEGSWWVYKNISNGKEDSVYTYNSTREIYSNRGQDIRESYEKLSVNTHSYYNNCNYSYFFDSGRAMYDGDPLSLVEVDRFKWKVISERRYSILLAYSMKKKSFEKSAQPFQYGYGHLSSIEELKGNILVNGKIYSNVIKVNDTINASENDQRTNFFIAKNVGIIKRELLDSNQTWVLDRYHVVQ
jgi:hypothetical protein